MTMPPVPLDRLDPDHRNQTFTGLDDYLDTFRLTRGIHKRVDVSSDALS